MRMLAPKVGVKFVTPRRGFTARRGTAAVEFAVVAPLLLAIVMGVIEVGRAITVQELLTNASRERRARMAGNDTTALTATVQAAVNNYLSNGGISGGNDHCVAESAVRGVGWPIRHRYRDDSLLPGQLAFVAMVHGGQDADGNFDDDPPALILATQRRPPCEPGIPVAMIAIAPRLLSLLL